MINRLFILLILSCFSLVLIPSCTNSSSKKELIVFHAGSLSVPFKQIATAFEKENPGIDVKLEAAGSRTCARKITDLNRKCDIMASADYKVIDNLLIPDHASANFKFASNQMIIAYSNKSEMGEIINSDNWIDILLNKDVAFGRSDPNSDPCGYRSVLVVKLASIYYKRPGLVDSLLNKDTHHMRPKEVDLLALLETQIIDYVFIYKSVAEQHQLKYLELSDSLNLGNNNLSHYYEQVSVPVSGKAPSDTIIIKGEPIVYGITQPKNSLNPQLAKKFLEFFLDENKGLRIIEENGQTILQ